MRGGGIGDRKRPTDRADRPKRAAADSLNGVKEGQTEFLTLQSERSERSGSTRAWREGQLGLRSQNETTRNPTPPPIAGVVRSLSLPPSVRPPRRSLRPDCNRGHSAPPAPPVSVVGHHKKRAAVSPPKGRSFEKNGEREGGGGDDGATPTTSGDSEGTRARFGRLTLMAAVHLRLLGHS